MNFGRRHTHAEPKLLRSFGWAGSLGNLTCLNITLRLRTIWTSVILCDFYEELPTGHTVCAIISHEPVHYSSFYRSLTSFDPSPSLCFTLTPPCLLFFFFFMVILLKELLAFISDYKKERLQRAALYLGHMFIRGNGLNSLLRQSCSLLALQKKSVQVF